MTGTTINTVLQNIKIPVVNSHIGNRYFLMRDNVFVYPSILSFFLTYRLREVLSVRGVPRYTRTAWSRRWGWRP